MCALENKEVFSKNLRRYMRMNGKDRNEIVEDLGFKYTTFNDWYNGNTYPRIDRIEKMANYFGITKADLIEENYEKENSIPLIGRIAAGTPILAEQNIEDYFVVDNHVKADFLIKVKGDSMINAEIYDGNLAFIRKQETLENGEIGAILVNGEATLKRFYKTDGTVTLMAENPKYQPMVYTNGDLMIMGKLVACLRFFE